VNETIWGLTGLQWAVAGGVLAMIGGGIGSAIGLSSASNTAAGIVTEDAEKFGRVLPLAAMPSTQGIYGFITAILVLILFGLLLPDSVPGIYQGLTSAGAAGMVARRSEDAGKALIFPALVETYAVFALITTVLMLLSLQSAYGF
jgi:V/A-type H+-transporting ATPase subunit K